MSEIVWVAVRIHGPQRTMTGGQYRDPTTAPFVVERALQQRGFQTYLPRRLVWRFCNGAAARRKQKQKVLRPLLVGWIFVGWEAGANRWRELFDTPGVSSVAGADGRPYIIQDRVLMRFADKVGEAGETAHERERWMRSRAEYAPGSAVRVVAGVFDGFMGTVVAVNKAQARILLPLFGQEREVAIEADLLEAA